VLFFFLVVIFGLLVGGVGGWVCFVRMSLV